MTTPFQSLSFAIAFGLLVMVVPCQGQEKDLSLAELQNLIVKLQNENKVLKESLVEANKAEKSASEHLKQIRERLEALGKNLLDGGDDRLIQAVSDLELANEKNERLEAAAKQLTSSIRHYMLQATNSDTSARFQVETAIRELDSLAGLRQKPRPDVRNGTLSSAKIVSLDPESGLLVFNVGEIQGANVGMMFTLSRGQQSYGKAILADVRLGVSGAFIEQLDSKNFTPRLGDTVTLLTQN